MTLRIARGITSLPKRVRVIAVAFLALMALLTLMSDGGPRETDATPESLKSASAGEHAVDDVPLASKSRLDLGASEEGKTAKIVTCPRCRLNSLPLVKKFVYDHAELFEPHLKVDFVLGEDPVLYLYDHGKEVEKVPLAVSFASPCEDSLRVGAAVF